MQILQTYKFSIILLQKKLKYTHLFNGELILKKTLFVTYVHV